MPEKKELTGEMLRVLGIAARDGAVAAGKGAHAGRVERVNASTVLSLIQRGLLSHIYSSEGGLGGRLTEEGRAALAERGVSPLVSERRVNHSMKIRGVSMKKSGSQLDREITEALARPSSDETQLYMSEACPHFALALHRLTRWPLAALVDEATYEEWDGEEYPTIAHVFTLRPDGMAVDVRGPRTVASVKKDFFDLEEPRVMQLSVNELASMMGDGKPLHACGVTEMNAAKALIKRHADLYLAGNR